MDAGRVDEARGAQRKKVVGAGWFQKLQVIVWDRGRPARLP